MSSFHCLSYHPHCPIYDEFGTGSYSDRDSHPVGLLLDRRLQVVYDVEPDGIANRPEEPIFLRSNGFCKLVTYPVATHFDLFHLSWLTFLVMDLTILGTSGKLVVARFRSDPLLSGALIMLGCESMCLQVQKMFHDTFLISPKSIYSTCCTVCLCWSATSCPIRSSNTLSRTICP